MIGLKRGTVKLYPHDPQWEVLAAQTINTLWDIFGDIACDIRHVGSTSICTIKAKPIIDIAVAVRELEEVIPLIPRMQDLGFYPKDVGHAEQIFFSAGNFEQDIRTHHIHVMKWNSMQWIHYLNFTEYLNKNPSVAAKYEACKEQLATAYADNREAYTEGKAKFINDTLRKALVYSYLGKSVAIKIDRPIGFAHKKDIVYSINYGYIPGILGGDGEELDVYLLGVDQPVREYTAQIIAIIHREDDVEDKLVAAPVGMDFYQCQIEEKVYFQEKYHQSHVEVGYRGFTIREYRDYHEDEILSLYSAVGWTNYTDHPDMLRAAFQHSLYILGAYDQDRLIGLIRAVGDGFSSVLIQDLLILPAYQHQGIGARLLREIVSRYASVYQIQLLTDDTDRTRKFYQSQGFTSVDELRVHAMMLTERPRQKVLPCIRPMQREEIDTCVSLIRASFLTVAQEYGITEKNAPNFIAFSLEALQLRQQQEQGRPMFVCTGEDKTLIGYYALCEKDAETVELNHLCVLPNARHHKIGEALLLHAFRESMINGYRRMVIGFVEENKKLRAWYEKYGFVHTGVKKFDFFPFTCGYMQKNLVGEEKKNEENSTEDGI